METPFKALSFHDSISDWSLLVVIAAGTSSTPRILGCDATYLGGRVFPDVSNERAAFVFKGHDLG